MTQRITFVCDACFKANGRKEYIDKQTHNPVKAIYDIENKADRLKILDFLELHLKNEAVHL